MNIAKSAQALMPEFCLRAVARAYLYAKSIRTGAKFTWIDNIIEIGRGNRLVRLRGEHFRYAVDIIDNFDFYFGAVEADARSGRLVVDYSMKDEKRVVGFSLHEVVFPALAEPLSATLQYMEFAGLTGGETVLDLGAYSGLTSIMFQEAVGRGGKVVAVDADPLNIACIETNFAAYARARNISIPLVKGAIWDHDDGVEFSSEGNMGASAASIVGRRRGHVERVPSFTLSTLAEWQALDRVDFIKCDIEGAERVIFDDARFFERFRPRMIIEAHPLGRSTTAGICAERLNGYDYSCRPVAQTGSHLPLLECVPG